jgi:copper chaperone
MTCMGCVNSVKKVLQAVHGVADVDVSLDKGEVAIQFDASLAGDEQFKRAIETAGFTVLG